MFAIDDTGEIRRRFSRALVRTERLRVEIRTADGKSGDGRSRNISQTGVSVDWKTPLQVGDELELHIGSLTGTSALRLKAKVVHASASGFGAHFVEPSDEARSYLRSLIRRLRVEPDRRGAARGPKVG
jgi:hypothetical protein